MFDKSAKPLAIFERARKPKKKKPYVHKPHVHTKTEKLIDPSALTSKSTPKSANPDTIKNSNDAKTVKNNQSFKNVSGSGPSAEAIDRLDKILGPQSGSTPPPEANTTHESASMSTLPTEILAGQGGASKSAETREKYHGKQFPVPTSRKDLRTRTQALLPVIPRLLAGDEELSIYYTLARYQAQKSELWTMTETERWDIQWNQYIAGFYGLERQQYVSALIQNEYMGLLQKSKNKTVIYWSPDMFSTYVLANEILLRMAMADLKVSKSEAEKILRETVDYGSYVADETPMADDLEYESEAKLSTGI